MDAKKKKLREDWIKKIALKEEEVMELFGISKTTIARLRRNKGDTTLQTLSSEFFK